MNLISTPKSPALSARDVWRTEDDLPEIWRQLIEAGFETGHAYAKALRMAKTCVEALCRYGVGDNVGLGVELENRYKGIRTPHKMKFRVSPAVPVNVQKLRVKTWVLSPPKRLEPVRLR